MFKKGDKVVCICSECSSPAYFDQDESHFDEYDPSKMYGIIRCTDNLCGHFSTIEGILPQEIVDNICSNCGGKGKYIVDGVKERVTCFICEGEGHLFRGEIDYSKV